MPPPRKLTSDQRREGHGVTVEALKVETAAALPPVSGPVSEATIVKRQRTREQFDEWLEDVEDDAGEEVEIHGVRVTGFDDVEREKLDFPEEGVVQRYLKHYSTSAAGHQDDGKIKLATLRSVAVSFMSEWSRATGKAVPEERRERTLLHCEHLGRELKLPDTLPARAQISLQTIQALQGYFLSSSANLSMHYTIYMLFFLALAIQIAGRPSAIALGQGVAETEAATVADFVIWALPGEGNGANRLIGWYQPPFVKNNVGEDRPYPLPEPPVLSGHSIILLILALVALGRVLAAEAMEIFQPRFLTNREPRQVHFAPRL